MNKTILLVLILLFSSTLYSQQLTNFDLSKRNIYWEKSKTQTIFGWILVGGGTAIIVGTAVNSSHTSEGWTSPTFEDLDVYVYIIGGIMIGGGCLLLLSARENRAKAGKISAVINLEKIPGTSITLAKARSFPTFGIRINLD